MSRGGDLLLMGAGLYVLGRGINSMEGKRRRPKKATKKAVRKVAKKPIVKKKVAKHKAHK